jgi:hypothetical protein
MKNERRDCVGNVKNAGRMYEIKNGTRKNGLWLKEFRRQLLTTALDQLIFLAEFPENCRELKGSVEISRC